MIQWMNSLLPVSIQNNHGFHGFFFGGGSGGDGDSERSADISRQAEEVQNIGNQFLSQLVPGSPEFNELQAEIARLVAASPGPGDEQALIREFGQAIVARQQERIGEGGPATALERRTGLAFEDLRGAAAFTPEEQSLLAALRGEDPTTPSGEVFQGVISRAQRTPEQLDLFESTFPQQLDLLQDEVNRQAARRGEGVLTGGLPIEQLGRAGVELSIQEARFRQESRQRARQEQQRNLENLESLFGIGQQLRGREIALEEAFVDLQAGRETKLTSLLQSQTGDATANLLTLLAETRSRSQEVSDAESAAAQSGRAGIGTAIGTGLGAGVGFIVGGPPGAAIGAGIGGGIGGGLAGGQPTATGLLGQQQVATAKTGDVAAGLSSRRRRRTDLSDLLVS